jgi:hypothetical protein
MSIDNLRIFKPYKPGKHAVPVGGPTYSYLGPTFLFPRRARRGCSKDRPCAREPPELKTRSEPGAAGMCHNLQELGQNSV